MILRSISYITLAAICLTTTAVVAESVSGINNSTNNSVVNVPHRMNAQQPTFLKERDKKGKHDFIEKLNLTSEQKTKIQQIRQQNEPKIKQIRDDLDAKEIALTQLIKNNASNESLRQKHDEIAKIRTELGKARFDEMLNILTVFTPQQKTEFANMMASRPRWGDDD